VLRQLIIDLDHVDAAIRIFDPSYDVEGIRQKIPTAAHRALRGDLTRATLDALRDALGLMTTKELARHVMAEHGLNTADVSLLQLFTRRTATPPEETRHSPIGQRRKVRSIRSLGDRGINRVLQVALRDLVKATLAPMTRRGILEKIGKSRGAKWKLAERESELAV
jgi:hypothetical protein